MAFTSIEKTRQTLAALIGWIQAQNLEKHEKPKLLFLSASQRLTKPKNPYGVILETPKGFFKTQKLKTPHNPYGVFLARAY